MRKNFLYSLSTLIILGMGAQSCSNNEDIPATETEVTNGIEFRIASALQEIMDNKDGQFDKGGYILYCADGDEMATCDLKGYLIASILTEKLDADNAANAGEKPAKAPKGNGWTLGGTCKNKVGAIALASKIANKIPKGANFEIHAEAQPDGSYKVWYRVIK